MGRAPIQVERRAMPERFGKYELLQKIAQGGMAEIFLATRQGDLGGFEKQVALKRIFRHLTGREETVNMFFDEARIAATLNHPNIVQVFDLGEVEGYFYIAMEFVHGTDLRRVCKRGLDGDNYLPLELAAHIVAEIAAGLHYAHSRTDEEGNPRNIVHRDISPQNVLLSMEGHVKICDFGIAKAENRLARTRTGQFKGKLSYMSPEQFNGEEVDARSDIFNLGIVLYEITLARRLFDAKTDFERMRQIANAQVTPPSEVDSEYPPELERIIMKALHHDPDERYQTAEEMQLEIEDWLHGREVKVGAVQVGNYMEEIFPELVGGIPEDMAQVEFPADGRESSVVESTLGDRSDLSAEEPGSVEGKGEADEGRGEKGQADERQARGAEASSSDAAEELAEEAAEALTEKLDADGLAKELSAEDKTEKLRPEEFAEAAASARTKEAGSAAREVREEGGDGSSEDSEKSTSGTYGAVTVDPSKQSASPSSDDEEGPTKKISVDPDDIAAAEDPSDLDLDRSQAREEGEGRGEATASDAPTKRTVDHEAPTKRTGREGAGGSQSDGDLDPGPEGRTNRLEIPSADRGGPRPPGPKGPGEPPSEAANPPTGGDADSSGPPSSGPPSSGPLPPSPGGPPSSGGPPGHRGPSSAGPSQGPPGPSASRSGGLDAGGSPDSVYGTGDTEPDNPPDPGEFESGGFESAGEEEAADFAPDSILQRTWNNSVGILTESDDSLTDERGRMIAIGIVVLGAIGAIIYIYLALSHSVLSGPEGRDGMAAKMADAAAGGEEPTVPRVSVPIETNPEGAFVVVNGLPAVDRTPAEVDLVEGEKNELYLYKPDHIPRRVLIEADGSELPVFDLESAGGADRGAVRITSQPKGAKAFLDGERVGTTPVTAEEIPRRGRHFLHLEKDGRHPVFALFELREEAESAISARLSISKGPEDDDYCEVVYDITPQGSMIEVNGEVQGTSSTSVRHRCNKYLQVSSWRSDYEDGEFYLFLGQPGKYLLRPELEKIERANGKVAVDAPDDVRVFIGANSYGEGTVDPVELPEGEYTAVFVPLGSKTRYEKTLKVVPGETTRYSISIQGGSATLERVE